MNKRQKFTIAVTLAWFTGCGFYSGMLFERDRDPPDCTSTKLDCIERLITCTAAMGLDVSEERAELARLRE